MGTPWLSCCAVHHVPFLRCGKSQVEFSLYAITEREYLHYVRPAQLCSDPRHNFRLRKNLSKLHHSAQIPDVELFSNIMSAQIARKPFNRPGAITRPFARKNVPVYPSSYRLVFEHDLCVGRVGKTIPCGINYAADIGKKRFSMSRRYADGGWPVRVLAGGQKFTSTPTSPRLSTATAAPTCMSSTEAPALVCVVGR